MTTNGLINGTVASFNDDKGYGFVHVDCECDCLCHKWTAHRFDSGCEACRTNHPQDIFVHFSAIDADTSRRRKLMAGQRVVVGELQPSKTPGKPPCAGYVRVVNQ